MKQKNNSQVLKAERKPIISTKSDSQIWKINNQKAQKNGSHRTIYWVKQQQKYEDGSFKGERWITDYKYIGDWKENNKSGFGIQHYGNGDKYEGGWENNIRNGQGTLWINDGKGKLRREYTGDWINDKKTGRGTMFYKNEDRYDGLWMDDKPHGEGRMIYSNGDVYEGFWFLGKRSGYGVLTKRNGDHFEGHWVNDKREGQGSYFFNLKNQVFVGEWVDDMPKSGVYSEVEDPENPRIEREKDFTDPYILPLLPTIKLKNPTKVLDEAMEKVRRGRTFYRAKYIPLDELYTKEEIQDLIREFGTGSNEKEVVNLVNLNAVLMNMNFELSEEEIVSYLKKVKEEFNQDEIDFELFSRLVAILLEENNLQRKQEENENEDENEEKEPEELKDDPTENYEF